MWEIIENDSTSQFFERAFKVDFSFIENKNIKDVVKDYIWHNYIAKNNTASTLGDVVRRFKYLNQFLQKRNIISLRNLKNEEIENFASFLRTIVSAETKKPLAYSTQRNILSGMKSIIRWCQIHRPDDVPQIEIFAGNEYTAANHKLKIDFIPDEIVIKINEGLITEENPYVKYGIIILQSTGMRVGDLLRLRTDCIKPHLISGHTISWFDHKNRRERPPMPVRSECVMAIDKLKDATQNLRSVANENDRERLFLYKPSQGIMKGMTAPISYAFIRYLLKLFTKRHNIMDTNGNPYNLSSHKFRRTLGTDMLSKGININVIQQVLGIVAVNATRFYADVKDTERAKVFNSIGIIGNINQLEKSAFDNAVEYEWFKANKDNGACMSDGYCTKPIVGGEICDRLLNRQKCYTCSRYITTPEYLDAHKNHLMTLERQLAEGSIYGTHYTEHFLPTIDVLKVIIERLEELKNAEN
jgi:site-specific recombinase XerD